jgi:hypothetical protein
MGQKRPTTEEQETNHEQRQQNSECPPSKTSKADHQRAKWMRLPTLDASLPTLDPTVNVIHGGMLRQP